MVWLDTIPSKPCETVNRFKTVLRQFHWNVSLKRIEPHLWNGSILFWAVSNYGLEPFHETFSDTALKLFWNGVSKSFPGSFIDTLQYELQQTELRNNQQLSNKQFDYPPFAQHEGSRLSVFSHQLRQLYWYINCKVMTSNYLIKSRNRSTVSIDRGGDREAQRIEDVVMLCRLHG